MTDETFFRRAMHWSNMYRSRGTAKLPFLLWLRWVITGHMSTEFGIATDLVVENSRAHAELLRIHDILMCLAECPPIAETDTWTVRGVKDLVFRERDLRTKVVESEDHVSAVDERNHQLRAEVERLSRIQQEKLKDRLEYWKNRDLNNGWSRNASGPCCDKCRMTDPKNPLQDLLGCRDPFQIKCECHKSSRRAVRQAVVDELQALIRRES